MTPLASSRPCAEPLRSHRLSHASVWRVMRQRITVWPASQKILEDSGFVVDRVACRPPNQLLSPNQPRRYSFYRIHIRGMLRMRFTGPVRRDTYEDS